MPVVFSAIATLSSTSQASRRESTIRKYFDVSAKNRVVRTTLARLTTAACRTSESRTTPFVPTAPRYLWENTVT